MHREATRPGITLRPARHEGALDDLDFLCSVYAAARADEVAQAVHWTDAQKDEFLRSQFRLQHAHYHEHFPRARYEVICEQGRPIGRLYVDHGPKEIRLMDIALLPDWRGRGIGGGLVEDLLAEADAAGVPVSLHVETTNPAKRLYERLGFRVVEDVGVYERMQREPHRG